RILGGHFFHLSSSIFDLRSAFYGFLYVAGLFLYRSVSSSCLVRSRFSTPRAYTCSATVANSNGSPPHPPTSASLPICSEPTRSETPSTSAGTSVTAFNASSHVMPYATALPAS